MARFEDKSKAIALRKKGMSYSQIKQELGINKSTLSGWLSSMPLSEKRIRELRDFSPMRIERCRNTKMRKRQVRLDSVYVRVARDIGALSERELFLAGLFLYWGEGGKTKKCTTVLTNTNPKMVAFFLKWLDILGVPRDRLRVHLHLYVDMDIKKQIAFWSKVTGLQESQFRKPHIKKSRLADITYKTGFGQGTCSVIYDNRDMSEYVLSGVRYISENL